MEIFVAWGLLNGLHFVFHWAEPLSCDFAPQVGRTWRHEHTHTHTYTHTHTHNLYTHQHIVWLSYDRSSDPVIFIYVGVSLLCSRLMKGYDAKHHIIWWAIPIKWLGASFSMRMRTECEGRVGPCTNQKQVMWGQARQPQHLPSAKL